MDALGFGIGLGALGAVSSLAGAEKSRANQLAQASQLNAQAAAAREQARIETEKGRMAAAEADKEKRLLRRQFEDVQAKNRTMLAAGNVDMTSGSALDVSLGNINRFGADMGENAYQRASRLWEARTRGDNLRYQADAYDANSSYLKQTAGNLGTSLLQGAIGGAMGFASGYSLAGGKLGSLFGSAAKPRYWDRALQAWTTSNPVH